MTDAPPPEPTDAEAPEPEEPGPEAPMTEERLALLETQLRRLERSNRRAYQQALMGHRSPFSKILAQSEGPTLAEAEAAYLAGKAQLERQNREAADRATAAMLVANQAMAEASRVAALASADAARWAKWAALFTLAAAVVTAAQAVWQALR